MAESQLTQSDDLADEDEDIQELLDGIDMEEEREEQEVQQKAQQQEQEQARQAELSDPVLQKAKDPQRISVALGRDTVPAKGGGGGDNDADGLAKAIMEQTQTIQQALWVKLQEDRELLDRYIAIFTSRIEEAENPKSVYVEAITSLLNTKATTSINSSRILDSMAKVLSAIRHLTKEPGDLDPQSLLDGMDSGDDEFDPEAP